ncbi:MAG: EAL domain-containing protein [Pseudomonadota bacterium]
MRTAVEQWRRWREVGLEITIAVNFSARNLDEIDSPDVLERLCRSVDVPCTQFIIEITETATASDEIKMMDIATRLRIKGFRISSSTISAPAIRRWCSSSACRFRK